MKTYRRKNPLVEAVRWDGSDTVRDEIQSRTGNGPQHHGLDKGDWLVIESGQYRVFGPREFSQRFEGLDSPSTPIAVLSALNPNAEFLASESNPTLGAEEALIGIVWPTESAHPVGLYDLDMAVAVMQDNNDDWSVDEILDWLEANVPVGEHAPFLVDIFGDSEDDDTEE
jgi:hypothetical protein